MERHIKVARFMANLLDRQFKIGSVRFGLDPILGIIPGLGDIVTLILSFYIFYIAQKMNVSKLHQSQMIGNIILDFFIGAIPVVGDIFDIGYKANYRNYKILEKYSRGKYVDGEVVESS